MFSSGLIPYFHYYLQVLVVVNDGLEARNQTYDLNMFKSLGSVSATRTSSSEQNVDIEAPPVHHKHLFYQAPPESITTFQIDRTLHESSGNLVRDGGFEESSGAWTLDLGNDGGISSSELVWRGQYSGFLDGVLSEVRMIQYIPAPKNGTYYLSATCLTGGRSAKLGVLIAGSGKEITIRQGIGYHPLAFSFTANQGEEIGVYFYSAQQNAKSYIDDVSLFYYSN